MSLKEMGFYVLDNELKFVQSGWAIFEGVFLEGEDGLKCAIEECFYKKANAIGVQKDVLGVCISRIQ